MPHINTLGDVAYIVPAFEKEPGRRYTSAEALEDYTGRQMEYTLADEALVDAARRPARTRDEYRVPVRANIDSADGLSLAVSRGADGIGLLCTEFLFARRDRPPSEEEHYSTYRDIVERAAPHPQQVPN